MNDVSRRRTAMCTHHQFSEESQAVISPPESHLVREVSRHRNKCRAMRDFAGLRDPVSLCAAISESAQMVFTGVLTSVDEVRIAIELKVSHIGIEELCERPLAQR